MAPGPMLKKPCKHCGVKHRAKPTAKEERWAEEYIVDLNATRATSVAYPNTSKANLCSMGFQILKRPHVHCMVRQLKLAQAVRTQIRADEVLSDIVAVARFDLGALFDAAGNVLPVLSWPEWARRIVGSYERTPDGGTKVKLPDRLRALELLGRHHKLFTDVLQVGGELSLREAMAKGRREARDREGGD